jgi:hypothetical protein
MVRKATPIPLKEDKTGRAAGNRSRDNSPIAWEFLNNPIEGGWRG